MPVHFASTMFSATIHKPPGPYFLVLMFALHLLQAGKEVIKLPRFDTTVSRRPKSCCKSFVVKVTTFGLDFEPRNSWDIRRTSSNKSWFWSNSAKRWWPNFFLARDEQSGQIDPFCSEDLSSPQTWHVVARCVWPPYPLFGAFPGFALFSGVASVVGAACFAGVHSSRSRFLPFEGLLALEGAMSLELGGPWLEMQRPERAWNEVNPPKDHLV